MQQFTSKYKDQIYGVISGFDRLVFRGAPRRVSYPRGMEEYLWQNQIRFKDYQQHVKKTSEQLKEASLAPFRRRKLPVLYLRRGDADKEQIARAIAEERGIRKGLVCGLSCLELSPTFEHCGTHMVMRMRPCLVIYHYRIDPEWGWMNARLQTWFPFNIQVCLNGREWLARQMDRERMRYCRQDNCFPWIQDCNRAQELLQQQERVNWAERLQSIARGLNPLHSQIFRHYPSDYYWSCFQSEWATDILFRPGELHRLEPLWLEHGLLSFSSPDVLRFLGQRVPLSGRIPARFARQLTTDFKLRQEGARIKHRIGGNSVKAYGKAHTAAGDVFRVELTINQVEQFRVYRPQEGGPADELDWRPMRRGIADLHRRAEVCQKANQRYLDALSQVDDSTRLQELIQPLEQPRQWKGKRVRALHPFEANDNCLLELVNRGEFTVNGLRNRDLQRLLYHAPAKSRPEARRRSAAVGRKLRLLRAHGLIQKVPRTHRYHLTKSGRLVILAVLTAQRASMAQLNIQVAA
jgi:hypothetical protein